jgi:tRNA(Ile)-lysidine synthase
MFRGEAERAGLALPLEPAVRAGRLQVRTRRPGDRIRPLGAPGARKLKDVLIDRRIPRERRDRLPLLCFGDRIAWVPGVTVDEAFRIPPGAETAWIAEVDP